MKQKKMQQRMTLCGWWTAESIKNDGQNADKKIKCPVKIPGSILSAATECGIVKDPYDRMNEYEAREFLDQDVLFSRTFNMEKQDGFV